MIPFLLSIVISILIAVGSIGGADAADRYLWIIRDQLASPAAIEALVGDAAELGATDLLVQVRGRGDAYYRSSLVPRRDERFDALATLMAAAHARRLRVHAWFNVFLVGSADDALHVANAHPGWIARWEDGRSIAEIPKSERGELFLEGAFLSPASPPARGHLLDVVSELVERYALDGLHWDYVRFPGPKGGFESDALQAFAAREALDHPSWEEWRAEQVSLFVREAGERARAARPGIVLSAAVMPDPDDAFQLYGQDWTTWVRELWIDRAIPMSYTTSMERLARWREQAISADLPPERVLVGLGVWKLSATELDAQMEWADANVPGGVALFSWGDLSSAGDRAGASVRAETTRRVARRAVVSRRWSPATGAAP